MICKIISGGQTGADQAALDAAIKLGISHGGWIPKGRLTENGPLPDKYQLAEMPGTGYALRTEQNVIDSNGTLIISHGNLSEGSDYTRKMAIKHHRPWLHIDLNKIPEYNAVDFSRAWMFDDKIQVLNVAGPRAGKDPQIYDAVFKIIKGIFWTDKIKGKQHLKVVK